MGVLLASSYRYTKDSIQRRREWIDSLKDVPCARCDNKFPACAMDFHHREPENKSFDIAKKSFRLSRERLVVEIEKCDVVCACCHRIIEFKEFSRKVR